MAFSAPGGGAMNRRNRALLQALAPLAFMGAIFYFSAQPSAGDHAWWEIVVRKLGHVGGYALLTALWAWTLSGVIRRPVLVAVCISLAYACTDEFHQTFVDGRSGTPLDVGVDAIGIALAALLIRERRASPRREGTGGARGRVSRSSLARSP
jgi:VanZ family protein